MKVRFTASGGGRYYVLDSTETWTEIHPRIATALVDRGYILELT